MRLISIHDFIKAAVAFCLIAALIGGTAPAFANTDATRESYRLGFEAYRAGNYEVARAQWRVAAQENDPHAQYALGLLYYRGDTGPADYEEAAKWFLLAAQSNHAGALYYLGLLYFNGWGVHYDQFRAHEYLTRALRAAPNNVNAAYILGIQYFHGRGVHQNFSEAASYFKKTARQNMPAGQYMLGALYERGWGVPRSFSDAYYWLKRAEHGTISVPPGAESDEPMDPTTAIKNLIPRLRPAEIKRVDTRLAHEAAG
ncbi:sel1 repeat family protein [Thalassospira sp. MA62]|nr:sel1 repeat family protein [Thalassospira sp. MA62]